MFLPEQLTITLPSCIFYKVVLENSSITKYLPYLTLIDMNVRSPLPMYLYWLGYFQWQTSILPLLDWGYYGVLAMFWIVFQANALELLLPKRFTLIKQCCFYFFFAPFDDDLSYIVKTKLLFVLVFLSYSLLSLLCVDGLTKCNALTWYSSPNTPISE